MFSKKDNPNNLRVVLGNEEGRLHLNYIINIHLKPHIFSYILSIFISNLFTFLTKCRYNTYEAKIKGDL
jgi:hypothetical protein